MDVRLPDGTIIQNVPDGMSKADFVGRLKSNGYDVSKLEEAPAPTARPSRMQSAVSDYMKAIPIAGPIGAGFVTAAKHLPDVQADLAYKAGEKVSDVATNLGASPEWAAGAGLAANVGTQMFPPTPVLAGKAAGVAAAPAIRAGAEHMMQRAAKPILTDLMNGSSAKAIQTMLDEGIPVTQGGMIKLKTKINDLNREVVQAIANSPSTINKSDVWNYVKPVLDKFKKQVNPEKDAEKIQEAWHEFRRHADIPGENIPVKTAQDLKTGTYVQLEGKYGELGSAETEAQKGMARGLKAGIEQAVPEVVAPNAKMSELFNVLNVTERRAMMELNKNPMGLSLLTHNPAMLAAYMADKSAPFKSYLALVMNASKERVPEAIAGTAATIPAFVAEQKRRREEGLPPITIKQFQEQQQPPPQRQTALHGVRG